MSETFNFKPEKYKNFTIYETSLEVYFLFSVKRSLHLLVKDKSADRVFWNDNVWNIQLLYCKETFIYWFR